MATTMSKMHTFLKKLVIIPIKLYKWLVSPFLPSSCRYWPTCSDYAVEAVDKHGVRRGLIMAAKRICRCHPWSAGGLDPVAENSNKNTVH